MADLKKLEKVRQLDERGLREDLLLPLLTRLGYSAPTIYHGSQERGKDIITYRNHPLGHREYLAVVAKSVDLSGSVSSSKGLREVIHQVEQCFDTPYEDLFGMTKVSIDRVWVVTSKRILSGAAGSILDSLMKNNLAKLIHCVSAEQLVGLIDEKYPAFWDDTLEPVDVLREQNARLAQFCRDLLGALGGNQAEIKATINEVLHSYSPPRIAMPPDRMLTRLAPYRVDLDSISEPYAHEFKLSCGSIREAFVEAKQKLYYAMFDVDDIMENYEKAIDEPDPKKFVDMFRERLRQDYPFFQSYGRRALDVDRVIEYLDDGLREYMELQVGLKVAGRWEWAIELVASVSALEPEIKSFLQYLEKDEFELHWRVANVASTPALRLEYAKPETATIAFVTHHKSTIVPSEKEGARPVTALDVTSEIQGKITEHLWTLVRKAEEAGLR
ncbi:MAG: hypothetical protein OXG04_23770 [Acidobacteria bacterium]|nr:hypothetical protein [Acidobacteriota bacterium]